MVESKVTVFFGRTSLGLILITLGEKADTSKNPMDGLFALASLAAYSNNAVATNVTRKKHLLIFVTPTIIDPAGNRVHTDSELPFSKDTVPPQPSVRR